MTDRMTQMAKTRQKALLNNQEKPHPMARNIVAQLIRNARKTQQRADRARNDPKHRPDQMDAHLQYLAGLNDEWAIKHNAAESARRTLYGIPA